MAQMVKYYVRLPEDLLDDYRREAQRLDVPLNALLWYALSRREEKTREVRNRLESYINNTKEK